MLSTPISRLPSQALFNQRIHPSQDQRLAERACAEHVETALEFGACQVAGNDDDDMDCVAPTLPPGGIKAPCGLGIELTLVLPPLLWLRRRRSGPA